MSLSVVTVELAVASGYVFEHFAIALVWKGYKTLMSWALAARSGPLGEGLEILKLSLFSVTFIFHFNQNIIISYLYWIECDILKILIFWLYLFVLRGTCATECICLLENKFVKAFLCFYLL